MVGFSLGPRHHQALVTKSNTGFFKNLLFDFVTKAWWCLGPRLNPTKGKAPHQGQLYCRSKAWAKAWGLVVRRLRRSRRVQRQPRRRAAAALGRGACVSCGCAMFSGTFGGLARDVLIMRPPRGFSTHTPSCTLCLPFSVGSPRRRWSALRRPWPWKRCF